MIRKTDIDPAFYVRGLLFPLFRYKNSRKPLVKNNEEYEFQIVHRLLETDFFLLCFI